MGKFLSSRGPGKGEGKMEGGKPERPSMEQKCLSGHSKCATNHITNLIYMKTEENVNESISLPTAQKIVGLTKTPPTTQAVLGSRKKNALLDIILS